MTGDPLRLETLARMDAWGLPRPPEHLPYLEPSGTLQPPPIEQIRARMYALAHVVKRCNGAHPDLVRADLERLGLWPFVAPSEFELFPRNQPIAGIARAKALFADLFARRIHGVPWQTIANFSWLEESLHAFAWMTGRSELRHLEVGDRDLPKILRAECESPATAPPVRPRSNDELRREADLHYVLHWAAVDARINGRTDPRLDESRLQFRRHAFDWMLGTAKRWDDVAFDT